MNCPVCNVQLNMMERSGVEIDYCSKCRGVWLDRGELDKIIERAGITALGSSSTSHNQSQPGFSQPNQSGFNQPYQSGSNQYNLHDSDAPHYGQHKKHKKREGFLGELFDF